MADKRRDTTNNDRKDKRPYTPPYVNDILEMIIKRSGSTSVSIDEITSNENGTYSIKGIKLG